MFEESMIESGGKRAKTQTWITFPLSFTIHLLLLAFVILTPLLKADSDLPEVRVINIIMTTATPDLPAPPAAAAKARKSSKRTKKSEKKDVDEVKPQMTGRLVAPIEVPEEIEEEDIADFGIEGGIEGGVEGGVEGGIIGGVIGAPVFEGADTEVVRVSSLKRPKLVREVKPIYPPVALRARIQGRVIIDATTDIYGRVRSFKLISGHPLLNQSAIDAVKQWVYQPYIINGVPKPVRFTVTVNFDLRKQ